MNSYLQYPKECSSPASRMDMAIRAPDRYASPWASVMKFDTRTINYEQCIHGPRERTEEVLFQTAHRVFVSSFIILSWTLYAICVILRNEIQTLGTHGLFGQKHTHKNIKTQLQVHKGKCLASDHSIWEYSWYQYLESRVIDIILIYTKQIKYTS